MLHGLAVCAWGLFAILTPFRGLDGWIVDGIAFGADLLVVGAILLLQSGGGRGPGSTWPFRIAGLVMLAAAGTCIALGTSGRAIAVMWTIFAYLIVDGLVLTLGTLRSPTSRFWGALGGAPMFVAALGILLLWMFFPGYDVMDRVFGVFGMFYGICVVTASLLARSGDLRGRPVV